MRARLVERNGVQGTMAHTTAEGVTTIGRASDNAIVIDQPGVSRYHAEIRLEQGEYVLVDLGSTNGTWLNGKRVTSPQRIVHGDIISLPAQPDLHLFFESLKETKPVAFEIPAEVAQRGKQEALGAARPSLCMDARTAELLVDEQRLSLTAKEYRAMSALYEQKGALVSKDELARRVWPEYDGIVADQNIEQLISRLRRKLGGRAQPAGQLRSVRGLGYRLDVGG